MTGARKRSGAKKLCRTTHHWRASDEIYRDLFENATDIVFTTDLSGHFLDGNKAVERLLGYTVEEAKGLTWKKLVASYDMAKAREVLKRHAKGERHVNYDLDTITKSGVIRSFEIGSRPIFEDEKIIGFHGIARDITERKRIQQELICARKAAENANHTKSTFLANMSHEIRTPINGVLGFLALMAKTELDEEQRAYLGPMEECAKGLLKIINDILDLSRIEAGQVPLEEEVFDLRAVLNSTVALFQPMASAKALSLSLHVDEGVPKALIGDETRIGQIVANLVNNAIKFTDQGRVHVRAKLQDSSSSRVTVQIEVTDSGIGIAPEEVKKLFEPFQQSDTSMQRKYGGTGLGLTITQNLVNALGGQIDIDGQPGHYTRVNVSLPFEVADQLPHTKSAHVAVCTFDGRGLRALVVDDNKINRSFLSTLLRKYSWLVDEAESGCRALYAGRRRRYDIVFMDIHMAHMDGIETARRFKMMGLHNLKTPVLAISADVLSGDRQHFLGVGLSGFIAKPISDQALVQELINWFPDRCKESVEESTSERPQSDMDQRAKLILDVEGGVQLASGDQKLWCSSLKILVDGLPDKLDIMECAAECGRLGDIKQIAHGIAGTAAYVAAHALRGAAQELEQCCNEANARSIASRLHRTAEEASRLAQLFHEKFDGN